MNIGKIYEIKDRQGRLLGRRAFSEAEMRMAAKAGLRVFSETSEELTPRLTGLFDRDGRPRSPF